MRRRAAALLLALSALALPAQAAMSVALTSSSTHTLALLSQASIPLQLAKGPNDSLTEVAVALSGTATGSKVADSNPGKYDVLYVNNTAATGYRMRLVLVSVTNQGDCTKCILSVKNQSSGAEQVHINITAGAVQLASGPWTTLGSDGTSGDEFHVWANHDVSPGKEVRLAYALEYTPVAAASPSVNQSNMTFVGRGNLSVSNNVFTPADFSIQAGESVTWHWVAGRHGIETLDGATLWCSERTAPAADCSRAFPTAGTYDYRCTRHTVNMVGVIRVT